MNISSRFLQNAQTSACSYHACEDSNGLIFTPSWTKDNCFWFQILNPISTPDIPQEGWEGSIWITCHNPQGEWGGWRSTSHTEGGGGIAMPWEGGVAWNSGAYIYIYIYTYIYIYIPLRPFNPALLPSSAFFLNHFVPRAAGQKNTKNTPALEGMSLKMHASVSQRSIHCRGTQLTWLFGVWAQNALIRVYIYIYIYIYTYVHIWATSWVVSVSLPPWLDGVLHPPTKLWVREQCCVFLSTRSQALAHDCY